MKVYLNPQGQTPKTLTDLKEGDTVQDALTKHEINVSGSSVRVNGENVDMGRVLTSDDVITIAQNVPSGR